MATRNFWADIEEVETKAEEIVKTTLDGYIKNRDKFFNPQACHQSLYSDLIMGLFHNGLRHRYVIAYEVNLQFTREQPAGSQEFFILTHYANVKISVS